MLQTKNITKFFQSGDTTVHAVDNVSITVPTGAFAAIVGKSGSGKSSLLSLLGALDKPQSGTITLDDEDITKLSDRSLVGYRREKIGFVFQGYNLIPNLSALENVMLPMEMAGVKHLERKTRASALLEQVGLSADKHLRKPAKLSGGEQQRVAIARALANRPSLILADEPTGNLDHKTSIMIVDLLKKISKDEQTTVIVVTHDLNLTEHTDMAFQLHDGKIVHKGRGKMKELLA